MNIILFSTGCPKCKIIEKKLKEKGIEYTENNDVQVMLSKGMKSAPALEVDGQLLDYMQTIAWINKYGV